MTKIKLEIEDTGNATANMVLLFNKFLEYGRKEAKLSPTGLVRFISIFEDSSTNNGRKCYKDTNQ